MSMTHKIIKIITNLKHKEIFWKMFGEKSHLFPFPSNNFPFCLGKSSMINMGQTMRIIGNGSRWLLDFGYLLKSNFP